VQLRHESTLTSEQYVTEEAWRGASLERCPLHPEGGCGYRRHGTYGRKDPPGARVARWYCRTGQTTFSLLPDCLAARLSGDLDEVEQVVAAVEAAPSVQAAADALRSHDVYLPAAIRWVRRRLRPVRAALLALVTLLPDLAGCAPTLAALGGRLGTPVLGRVRERAEVHLGALAAPVGFGPRPRRVSRRDKRREHEAGPDPPPRSP